MQKLGFNIHRFTPEVASMLTAVKPKVVLALAAGVNGEWGLVDNILATSPTTTVIYRPWSIYAPGDLDNFGWWLSQGLTDDVQNFIGPLQPTIDRYGDRIVYHLFNETGIGNWQAYIGYQAALVREFSRRGLRVCALNQAPGTPGGEQSVINETFWRPALPLFQAIADTGYRSVLGFHDYFTGLQNEHNWMVGRYEWMQSFLRDNGYSPDRFKIAITEYGFADNIPGYTKPFDTGHASIAHFLATGEHTQDTIAGVVAEHHRQIYDPNPAVLGSCFFTLGRVNDDWKDYDLAEYPSIRSKLIGFVTAGPVDPPGGDDVVNTGPLLFKLNTNVNVREQPSTSAKRVATFYANTVVATTAYTDVGGLRWRAIPGYGHWIAEGRTDGSDPWMDLIDCPECPDNTQLEAAILARLGIASLGMQDYVAASFDELKEFVQDTFG